MRKERGNFTIPGEAGYEQLTLHLAEKWGADVIRDSDGTQLSDEIIHAGYGVYSTVCPIRDHNAWLIEHPQMQQQAILVTMPMLAEESEITISLLKDFFSGQFRVNDSEKLQTYWQVFDRTTGQEVPRDQWEYHAGTVRVHGVEKWHRYTVSFFAYRIWEEISMYNHMTNGWEKEHLMQIDPIHEAAQDYLLQWMDEWCLRHPNTTVVRFTSLFYNFAWIWGSDERRKEIFCDWASYDFTTSPQALDAFEQKYGYRLTAEDFVNQGKYQVTHMPPTKAKLDYMHFVNDFVISFGKRLIEIVHRYGKKAYLFYDDSWVGSEPYGKRFQEFGFDGIIKAAFSGFEARLCGGVDTAVHELRLHPYLFPTGVDGSPSFLPEGMPEKEAQTYWLRIRRALLRQPVDRIGLGGYLHLVEEKQEFVDYMQFLADEFREIKELHSKGAPKTLSPRIGVLHVWGGLRSWTCSGHFHENKTLDLMHVLESLSGLPFHVEFLRFDEATEERLDRLDVIINAGTAGSAWSGGCVWNDAELVARITKWVYHGGVFLGINEPSAADGGDQYLKLAHILGVDLDTGAYIRHGKWKAGESSPRALLPNSSNILSKSNLFLTDPECMILQKDGETPSGVLHRYGNGVGIYLGGYRHNCPNSRMLQNLILYSCGEQTKQDFIPDNDYIECAWYPEANTMLLVNNSNATQCTCISVFGEEKAYTLSGGELKKIVIQHH